MDAIKIKELYNIAINRINTYNIGCFEGRDKPLFLISDEYPGVWLEHLYDSVLYAKFYPENAECLVNVLNLFIDNQTKEGQLPCYVWNKQKVTHTNRLIGYGQIQEVVSFSSLCFQAYEILGDKTLLLKCYNAGKSWIKWLETYRQTQKLGLIEAFVGYDTGHDNSKRFYGINNMGTYRVNGEWQNASILPPNDNLAPIIAVDMNCNYFGNLVGLSKMANVLGLKEESDYYLNKSKIVKEKLFEICYDKTDNFFYDVDKHGNKIKIKSSVIFHLFLEKVLDKRQDKLLIESLYKDHIKNPEEFWTNYPFPSVAINDKQAVNHEPRNCWGYYTQMLIVLRCILWMDYYGFSEDFNHICKTTLTALTNGFNKIKFGQELDPVTGEPTDCSEYYSSCMLFYIYASKRLNLI